MPGIVLMTLPTYNFRPAIGAQRQWPCKTPWASQRRSSLLACHAQQANAVPVIAPLARVYVGRMPLVGMEGLAEALGVAGQLMEQHTYTLIDMGDGQVCASWVCLCKPVCGMHVQNHVACTLTKEPICASMLCKGFGDATASCNTQQQRATRNNNVQVFLCDFLPVSPTSPATAAALLSGGAVQGELYAAMRGRTMSQIQQLPAYAVTITTEWLKITLRTCSLCITQVLHG